MTARRIWALALLAAGGAAIAVGLAVAVLAAPARLHCVRATQSCEWDRPGLFGGTHEVTLAIGSLHDSRVEYTTDRTGLSTRWVVGGPDGALQLASPTNNTADGQRYEQLAHDLQAFLDHSRQPSFDATFAAIDRHLWVVLAIAGLLVLGGGVYLWVSARSRVNASGHRR